MKYRGRNIADVLEMTVREAFTFFRGRPKVQARAEAADRRGARLSAARPAGQHALAAARPSGSNWPATCRPPSARRSLVLLDEPTTGLHFADVVQLLDCFEALLAVGHSLIVVEHNLQLMKAADYIIDLGPGAADEGGRVVAEGTPEFIARQQHSATGQFLAAALEQEPQAAPVEQQS